MTECGQDKVGLIINDASYDKVAYALIVASTSAATGKEVHVLFTYGAILRLLKGKVDKIGEETGKWISEYVTLGSVTGAIPKISKLLNNLKKFEGRICACVSAMALHNIIKDELIEEVDEVTSISAFLEKLEGGSTMLYV